tara:strand:- start:20 stop:502 length:483 start_codon:yes stop_codon:yes gene_type:complete
MDFYSGGSYAMRLTSTGIIAPQGIFIGGTVAANNLDDYEEGTWSPYLSDGTASISLGTGTYTKIGRIVTIQINSYNNSNFSSLNTTGALRINGFPFTGSGGAVPFATNNPNGLFIGLDIGTSSYLWNTASNATDYSFITKTALGITGTGSMRGLVTYATS